MSSNVYDSEEGYNLWAGKYDESLAYLDSFEKEEFLRMLGNVDGKKVLDVGCGTGRLYKNFLFWDVDLTGIDVSEEMLKIARKKFPRVKFVKGEAEELPFEDGCFDIVMASFLIVHLKGLEAFFEEVYRVLKKGGIFLLTNINQKKAPKLKGNEGKEIVIKSYYHMPKHVILALEKAFFEVAEEKFTYEREVWVAQVIKAIK